MTVMNMTGISLMLWEVIYAENEDVCERVRLAVNQSIDGQTRECG